MTSTRRRGSAVQNEHDHNQLSSVLSQPHEAQQSRCRQRLSSVLYIKPATADACAAREILQKEPRVLTVTGELGLLRRWYEGSKHLIGSDS